MFPSVRAPSPYDYMDDLARHVCSDQLKPSTLKSVIWQLFPDNTPPPDYIALVQGVLNYVKTAMRTAFLADQNLRTTFQKDQSLQESYNKEGNQFVGKLADRYGRRYESLESVKFALQRLGYTQPPSQPLSQSWCVIC